MALDGGGGGPVGTTNSFTGAAQALEYMGNGWWGGWSGDQTLPQDTEINLFEFTSPLKNLVGEFGFSIDLTNSTSVSDDIKMEIQFNDIAVFNLVITGAIDRAGNAGPLPTPKMIIPAGTIVKVIMMQTAGVVITGSSHITAKEL